jgi:iron complex outermembrane receptor protein
MPSTFRLALVPVPLAFLTGPALAEPRETIRQLDPVIVTATQRAQPLSEVPGTVAVIGGDRAEPVNDFDGAEEVTGLVTGVQAAVANAAQIAFQIRGIGAVDHQALTPSAAAVYSDGVFLATNVQTGLLTYDIARIEVLKGPQGTLYGRNSSSGAINFITRRPGPDQSGYIEAGYGRFDRIDLKGAGGLAVGDTAWVRLAGRYLSEDSPLDNVSSTPDLPAGPDAAGGERDELGLRASLLWQPAAPTELLLRGHYEEDNGINASPRNDTLDLDDHEISVAGDGLRDTDNEFYGTSAEFRTRLAGWQMTSLTAIEGYNQQYGFDFDGTPAPFGDPTLNANLAYDRDYWQASQEVRLQRGWQGGHSLLGLALSGDDFSQRYTIWCGVLDRETGLGTCRYVGAPGRAGPQPASPGTATTLVTDIAQTRETAALFTRNEFDLAPQLTAILGARVTYENIEGSGEGRHIFDDGTVGFNNRGGVGPATGANRIEDTRLTGNAALRYELAGGGTAYALVANGYKSGGFNGEVQNNATHFSDEGLFGAETVTAWELGFKSEPTDQLAWTLSAFHQDYDAPQARIFVQFDLPDGSSIISNSLSNLDAGYSRGIEGTLSWRPIEGLDLDGGLTLLDTEIEQDSDLGGNAELFDGNPLPFASRVSATLGARYEWKLGEDVRAALRANGKYRSEFYLDAEGLEARSQEGYTTLDAEASLLLERYGLTLALWGRNLLDEDYAVSGFGFIGYNTFRSKPASWGVRVRRDF